MAAPAQKPHDYDKNVSLYERDVPATDLAALYSCPCCPPSSRIYIPMATTTGQARDGPTTIMNIMPEPDPQPQPHSNVDSEVAKPVLIANGISSQRSEHVQRQHNAWREDMAKFFAMFKVKACPLGAKCDKGINCMDYHDEHDRRRRLDKFQYAAQPCPNIYDFHGTKKFFHDRGCPEGDDCQYTHNYMELGFHPDAYKVDACPYLDLSRRGGYEKEECPFVREEQWFRERFHVWKSKARRNMLYVRVGGHKLHLCLDMCCFWHSEMDRRYIGDPPMPMPMSKEQTQSAAECSAKSDPNVADGHGHGGDVRVEVGMKVEVDVAPDEQSDVVDEDAHDVKESEESEELEELEELEEMITNMNAVWKQMLKIKKLMEGVESAMPWHNLNSLDDSIKKLKKRDGSE